MNAERSDGRRNNAAHDAALRGASFAFGKPAVKPKPAINTYSGSNGALVAATRVGGGSRSASQHYPGSRLEAPIDEQRLVHQRSGASSTSGSYTPDQERRFVHAPDQTKSPSFIAATIAASRSVSVTPNHTGQLSSPAVKRQSSFSLRSPGSVRSVSSMGSLDQPLDTSSIPPTNALISKFEHASPSQLKKTRRTAGQRSIAPQRASLPTSSGTLEIGQQSHSTKSRIPPSSVPELAKQRPEIKSPKPTILPTFAERAKRSSRPLPLPVEQRSIHDSQLETPLEDVEVRQSRHVTQPIPIPTSRGARSSRGERAGNASSDDSLGSAPNEASPETAPSFRVALQNQNRQQASRPPHSVDASAAAVESLANAIVASSLASSRAASPSKTLYPPKPPAPRRSSHKHLFHNDKDDVSRTPSPAKGPMLRTTMRKPKAEEVDESDKRRGRKNLMKKHPNKHHEGDRKRWRDEITERERKRYEAVWASNKGLHLGRGLEAEVCNLVARDIFSRSRLDSYVLEEVYALIDRKVNGALAREEFVVGLWLIDQRLKGRKLPIRVSDSVWRSVGGLGGIKVRKAGR